MKTDDVWKFSEEDKETIKSLLEKGRAEQARNERFAVIGMEEFLSLFSEVEIVLIRKFLDLDPKSLEYRLPYLGAGDTPEDIVAIKGQRYEDTGGSREIPCQFLPAKAYEAYTRMNKAMEAEIGKKLLVLYGHRSVARQAFIFFDILERHYNFDLAKTIRRVCLPDYSEHVCTHRQAIDFKTEDSKSADEFDATEEYAWLKARAGEFGFYESYPKGNDLDMMYEPWHWHFED
jgi:hypothetical protein